MDAKLSAKRNGKWWTYGTLKTDPRYGNLRVSFKVTEELRELVNGNEWLNFSVFDNEKKEERTPDVRQDLDDDSLPF